MYDEIVLIDRIASETGYNVSYAEDTTIESSPVTGTAPKVYVGHIGIKVNQTTKDVYANGYNELENPSVLLTSIQFVCERAELTEVRTNIANAYKGFTPYTNDEDFSSLVFIEAHAIAKTGTKIWWQEIVGLIFPRIS